MSLIDKENRMNTFNDRRAIVISAISIVLLAALLAATSLMKRDFSKVEIEPIIKALKSMPAQLQSDSAVWIRLRDVAVPTDQSRLLDLKAYSSGEYRRLGSYPPITAILFIAYSQDARSMMGHHPPKCYPANGWRSIGPSKFFTINRAEGREVKAVSYRFSRQQGDQVELSVVNGFFAAGNFFGATLDEAREVVQPSLLGGQGLFQFQILLQDVSSTADVESYAREIIWSIPPAVFDVSVGSPVRTDEDALSLGGES